MAWTRLILWGFCLGSCLQFPLRRYYYVDQSVTWPEAQQYCRKRYNDLATFESLDDLNRLETNISYTEAWFGLWDDPKAWKSEMGNESNSWRWSATGETSKTGYRSWATGEPNFTEGKENCASIYAGKWHDQSCDLENSFACYTVTEQNVKQYVYNSPVKTWSAAQTYCRTHHTDLAVIESEAETSAIRKVIKNDVHVWIGLYRVPWRWSDKSPTSFLNEGSLIINNYLRNQHCLVEEPTHQWHDDNCMVKRSFICQQVSKMAATVRMTGATDSDLTDPAVNAQLLQQLGALLTTQGWTDFKMQWKILPKKKDKN